MPLPRILLVDDNATNLKLLNKLLGPHDYDISMADSGAAALEQIEQAPPDIVLLDVVMPEMSGYEVCRAIRANPNTRLLPVIMVTALDPSEERVKGIEAGADDFLEKPINSPELLARIRSLLATAELHKKVQSQAAELAELNRTLEERVQAQVGELERVSQLKRFLPTQVAELIVDGESQGVLDTHRRNVTIAFINLRGFGSFAESEEPEVVMATLREYHKEMGRLVQEHQGTLERFTGDGMMVVFNDPVEVDDPEQRALHMVVAMREAVGRLRVRWESQGFGLGFGASITAGYATIGTIGFEGRMDYAAIGHAVNLAARLCDVTTPGQILVSQRVMATIASLVDAEPLGELQLKDIPKSTRVFEVLRLKVEGETLEDTRHFVGPGSTLDRDRYRLERVLGVGGMATAYLARDKRLERQLVIKIPHEHVISQPGFRQRFRDEMRNLTRLNHPNIVKVYDAGEEAGIPYGVVQYLSGGELSDRTQQAQTLDQVLEWLPDIADALDYIHGQGILHRDVKPRNILFDEAGRAYICDFGIAKTLTDSQDLQQTQTGNLMGSYRYIAPEYIDRQFGPACDQYSLAVVVYYALAQRFPHSGDTVETLIFQKQNHPPTPLDENLGVPKDAVRAVMRALSAKPGQRFESCASFAESLARASH